jgi:hypothetical protein
MLDVLCIALIVLSFGVNVAFALGCMRASAAVSATSPTCSSSTSLDKLKK